MEEEKEYLPIDLSKNRSYATVEEMMRDCVSPRNHGGGRQTCCRFDGVECVGYHMGILQ